MDDRQRCTARSSRTGERCRKARIRGATVCGSHGGRAKQVKKAAQQRVEAEAAEEAVVTYGLPVDVDPADALMDEVKRTYGHVWYLLAKVQEQDPAALVWGLATETDKGATEFPGVDRTYAAKPNAWLELYDRERQRLVAVCTAALKAGVEERRVRLVEAQQQQTAEFMRRVVAAFGIPDTPETWKTIRAQWEVVEGGNAG